MSDHESNTQWWLSKSDIYWTQAELRQLKDDVPDLDEYWKIFTLYEDPYEYTPGLISQHQVRRLILLDSVQPECWYDSNPVVADSGAFVPRSAVAAIGKMCIPYGVAVVFDQGRLSYIGRREPVEMIKELIQGMAKRCRSMQSILPRRPGVRRKQQVADWWSVFDQEAKFILDLYAEELRFMPTSVLEGYRRRVSLLKLQHAVYQVHQGFRNWEPPEGSPEVVLKPVDDGGRLLGGVVWRLDTYETQEGLTFLGLG